MVDVDDDLDHQGMAIELIDAFAERDAAGLAALDAAGRAAQVQARQALYDYVDRIWEDAKAPRSASVRGHHSGAAGLPRAGVLMARPAARRPPAPLERRPKPAWGMSGHGERWHPARVALQERKRPSAATEGQFPTLIRINRSRSVCKPWP
ncbi:hypothetical protein [Micromonospora maris]|uniref:hypothetical protein n=1 Tax=Micromonospora maris TaxID=1003110 RepID=UPI0011D1CB92|nr:hypothetical protein [Micromonospora maris]